MVEKSTFSYIKIGISIQVVINKLGCIIPLHMVFFNQLLYMELYVM